MTGDNAVTVAAAGRPGAGVAATEAVRLTADLIDLLLDEIRFDYELGAGVPLGEVADDCAR